MKRTGPIESSTLSPNTQRNHMFPMMWNQPPCMNIEVKGLNQFGGDSITQPRVWLSGTTVPGGTRRSSSPGLAPYSQTEVESDGSLPRPWTKIQTAMLMAMMWNVASEVESFGFSSRSGNRGRYEPARCESGAADDGPRAGEPESSAGAA